MPGVAVHSSRGRLEARGRPLARREDLLLSKWPVVAGEQRALSATRSPLGASPGWMASRRFLCSTPRSAPHALLRRAALLQPVREGVLESVGTPGASGLDERFAGRSISWIPSMSTGSQ